MQIDYLPTSAAAEREYPPCDDGVPVIESVGIKVRVFH